MTVLAGTLYKILPIESGIGKRGVWKKQNFILETQEDRPKKILVTILKEDLIEQFDSLYAGDNIEVSVNIESKEFNERWFTNINAWKITKL